MPDTPPTTAAGQEPTLIERFEAEHPEAMAQARAEQDRTRPPRRPASAATCECERTDHPQFPDGRCHREGDGAEAMTGGKVVSSPALCLPCLFACEEE